MPDISEQGILIVDDEESVLISLRRLLKSQGFSTISSALNAKQAIKFIKDAKKPFFLIIADQTMPDMTGSEFLEKCVVLTPESRRMLMTGYSNLSSLIEGINKGNIQKYIVKPWDNDALLKRIMDELQIYEIYHDKKNLLKTTEYQNAHFYRLAKKTGEEDIEYQKEISLKEDEIDSLNEIFEKIKTEAKKGEESIGLDGLLARNIIINQDNLARAFSFAKKEVSSFLSTLSKKNNITFSQEDIKQLPGSYKVDDKGKKIMFEIIDLVIDLAGKKAEPILYDMGAALLLKSGIDSYETLPGIGELAHKEGYITRNELDQAREQSKDQGEKQKKIDSDKVLLASDLITRMELSRLIVKRKLIDIRLKDRTFASELIEKEFASKKAIKQAFVKQLNIFEEDGGCVILGDILVKENAITPQLRDEILTAHGRLKEYGKEVEPDSTVSAEKTINLHVSEDKIMAYIKMPGSIRKSYDVQSIKELLKNYGIKFGIVEDKLINEFLKNAFDSEKKFIVARGRASAPGKDARIKYYFNTRQKKPGIITEDGTIDFRDRGDIFFVKKWELLAEKIPLIHGKHGCDVFGVSIPVDDAQDYPLKGGKGTRWSENNLELLSDIEGTPMIDAKGEICVLKELNIKGDVDFKTGHINFPGNVNINGVIKEGFRVKCVDLTVNEIIGGIIETSGDINVSTGILDSQVRAQGNIQAKFVKSSEIEALGDISIMREIMESKIAVSGEFLNEKGRITASVLAAKKGFTLWQVGTQKSSASTIKAGGDDHTQKLVAFLDDEIAKMQKDIDQILSKEKGLGDKNFEIHKKVSDKSLAQEKMHRKKDLLKKQLIGLNGKKTGMIKTLKKIKEIELNIRNSDKEIKDLFKDQDKIIKEIEAVEQKIRNANAQMEDLIHQKKSVLEAAEVAESIPVVRVKNCIFERTTIKGSETSMIIRHKLGPCKIMEIKSSDPDDLEGKQMVIQNL